MSGLKTKTLYLNTSDILTSAANHCDATFDVSRFSLLATNNQRLSLSLRRCVLPTRTTYLDTSGVDFIMEFSSNEPFTESRKARAGVTLGTIIKVAISNNIYQPPFVVNGDIFMAIPFYIQNSVEDLINHLNTGLDFRYEGDIPADCAFQMDQETGIVRVSGSATDKISIDNEFFMPFFENTFTLQGQRVAEILGINTDHSLAPVDFTILSINDALTLNRDPEVTFTAFVGSEGVLLTTNLNLDSFCSVANGVTNVLSNIPTTLGVVNQFYQLNGGSEITLAQIRTGAIVHDNMNVDDSHKTCSDKRIGNLRLQIRGLDNDLRFCNTNISYVIEVRWFI